MKLQQLTEMPRLISDRDEFDLKKPDANKLLASDILQNKSRSVIWSINDHIHLYECGTNTYALINTEQVRILYWVKFKVQYSKLIGKPCIQQVEVWRTPGDAAEGIAKRVFFEVLLPKTGCIITDAFQTSDGKRFWLNRIQNAFDLNIHVYFVSLIPMRQVIELHDLDDVYQLEQQTWGDAQSFEAKRIIISTHPLQ